jgi:Secretion system C-terminal sorting domain
VTKDTVNLNGLTYLSGVINSTIPVRWEKIDGPGTVTFSSPTSRQTSARFGAIGTYTLRISAEDDYKINEPTEAKFYSFCDYIVVETKGNATKETPNNVEISSFKISPNPNIGDCQISWNSTSNYKTIRLFDPLGKLVLTKSIDTGNQQVMLNLAGFSNGIYIAEMENINGRKIPLKVIKNDK